MHFNCTTYYLIGKFIKIHFFVRFVSFVVYIIFKELQSLLAKGVRLGEVIPSGLTPFSKGEYDHCYRVSQFKYASCPSAAGIPLGVVKTNLLRFADQLL